MSLLLKPCVECGEVSDQPHCIDHRLQRTPKTSAVVLGYDRTWRNLSLRARRLQPFCLDCGSPEDLTADHSPRAWARKAAGKHLRLCDVSVLCLRCNSDAGPARPGSERFEAWETTDGDLNTTTPESRGGELGSIDVVVSRRAKAKFLTDRESFSVREVI